MARGLNRIKSRLLVIILIITIIIASFSGCTNEDNNSEKQFLVSCVNSDIISHSVKIIIVDEENSEIYNSTKLVEPETTIDLYRSDKLPVKEYLVIVIVDSNWTDNITHHPSSTSFVSLHLASYNAHDLFIKHKD